MFKLYPTFIFLFICFKVISQSGGLFFSEYIEGSENNKAIEIFNPDNQVISLDSYRIAIAKEGGEWLEFEPFANGAEIAPLSSFVLLHISVNPDYFSLNDADQVITLGSSLQFNGDDALALVYIESEDTLIVDVIGETGKDPGRGWKVANTPNSTYNNTLIRKEYVYYGNPDWSISAGSNTEDSEWIIRPENDFSDLGKHTFNPFIIITEIQIYAENGITEIDLDGGSLQCFVQLIPDNASNKNLSWSSSDPMVAVVDETGKVTAFGNGNCHIIVSTKDGSELSDSIEISTSNQSQRIPVSAVNIYSQGNKTSIETDDGSLQMIAGIMPSDATETGVDWFTDDNYLAEIDASGLLTAKNNGIVTVSARTIDGTGIEASKEINILNQYTESGSISFIRNSELDPEKIFKLNSEVILTHQVFLENKKYVQDESGGFEISDPEAIITSSYQPGDGITGLLGYLEDYFGMLQFIPLEDPGPPSSVSNVILPKELSIIEFNSEINEHESEIVLVKNLRFLNSGTTFEENSNYKAFYGSDTIVFRTQFPSDIIGSIIPYSANITGIALEFNATPKIAPRSLDDIEVLIQADLPESPGGFEIQIFPNPAKNYIKVKTGETIKKLVISDLNGKLLVVELYPEEKQINIEALDPGIYFIEIYGAYNKTIQKIIKQ